MICSRQGMACKSICNCETSCTLIHFLTTAFSNHSCTIMIKSEIVRNVRPIPRKGDAVLVLVCPVYFCRWSNVASFSLRNVNEQTSTLPEM